jgi:hypothetical protein
MYSALKRMTAGLVVQVLRNFTQPNSSLGIVGGGILRHGCWVAYRGQHGNSEIEAHLGGVIVGARGQIYQYHERLVLKITFGPMALAPMNV